MSDTYTVHVQTALYGELRTDDYQVPEGALPTIESTGEHELWIQFERGEGSDKTISLVAVYGKDQWVRAWIEKEGDESIVGSMASQISRLTFEARELIDMFGDVVEKQAGKTDEWARRVRDEIDKFRESQGWSKDGYGGEDEHRAEE